MISKRFSGSWPCLGLTGPWLHKYPHFAVPGPQIGFLQECLRWWDHWLKGQDSGIMAEPRYRAYMQDSTPPRAFYTERAGRWIAELDWPSPNISPKRFVLNPGRLDVNAAREQALTLASPQTTGLAGGEYCAMWLGPEAPGDQRVDDAGSLTFDSKPLDEPVEIFGAPLAALELSVDRSCALLAARLCDVAPDGASTRVTYGVLNLTHRDSHEAPTPLVPGERYMVRLQLDDVAYAFPTGHRIRLALSTAYWPLVWPSPEAVTLTLVSGNSTLELPIRATRDEAVPCFEEPESAPPPDAEVLREAAHSRIVEQDQATGETRLTIIDDFGETRNQAHGLATGQIAREVLHIHPDDPLSAQVEIHWTETLSRNDWSVRTESYSAMISDREAFRVTGRVEAYEGAAKVFERAWDETIARDLV